MPMKDDILDFTATPQDGSGFMVAVKKYEKNTDGTYKYELDDAGEPTNARLIEVDVHAFTNFNDMGQFILSLDT